MKFEQKKALALISKYELSKNTLSTWKSRGAIPDKYNDLNYTKVVELSPEILHLQNQVLTMLKLPYINLKEVCILADVKRVKIQHLLIGSSSYLLESEIKKLKHIFERIARKIEKTFYERNNKKLLELFSYKPLHTRPIILSVNVNTLYSHTQVFKKGISDLSNSDYELVKKAYQTVLTKIEFTTWKNH